MVCQYHSSVTTSHDQMYPGYYFKENCQFLWSVFPSELATVQLCTTSKVAGKRTDRPCTDSLTSVKSMGGKWLNLNYLIEPLVGSGNCSLWMKLLLLKWREELATALNSLFVPISVSYWYFNLQWKIHKVVTHWVRPSLVHSLFPVTACINF